MTSRCDSCGRVHDGLPDLACRAPDPYLEVPQAQRWRTSFTEDWCSITHADGTTDQFLRGVLHIPLRDAPGAFDIGMWVSQSRENLFRFLRGEAMDRTFGWVSNHLRHCATPYGLKACLVFGARAERPAIELAPSTHVLVRDATFGITLARAWEIVDFYGLS